MICNWSFRNEPTNNFSEKPAFRPNSRWKPSKFGLEVFFSRVEKEHFSDEMNDSTQSNPSEEEWMVLRDLADDRNVLIKSNDKGSSVVVWDKDDYLLNNYGTSIYTKMLHLTKIFLLVYLREETKYSTVCVVLNQCLKRNSNILLRVSKKLLI